MHLTIYRGKTISDGRIVQGGAYEVKCLHSSSFWIVDHSGSEFRVDPDSIAPATDFFDANGKRIFINDKIRFHHHLPNIDSIGRVVQCDDGLFAVNFPYLTNNNAVHSEPLAQIASQSTII